MNIEFQTKEYTSTPFCAPDDKYETMNSESNSSYGNNINENDFLIE